MDGELAGWSRAFQARKLLGIRDMLCEIGRPTVLPMAVHVDNQAALEKLAVEASSLKAKQIDIRNKLVCDYTRHGVVVAQYVRSDLHLEDLLAKALDDAKLAEL